MAAIVDPSRQADLLRRAEKPRRMLRADLPKAESNEAGEAIERARLLRGWSLKELAGAAQRGERQVGRWIDGREHPQLDTLFAIVSFRKWLVVALAERAGVGVSVHTTITIGDVA